MSLEVRVVRLVHAIGLPLPSYATRHSAGADLVAALDKPVVLEPGDRRAIPTGLVMEIPDGYEGQVRPRSGLALRQGLTVANAPGTIDADYRGEVKVLLVNLGSKAVTITRGERIAQLVIAPVERVQFTEAGYVVPTARGKGGFGSTGA